MHHVCAWQQTNQHFNPKYGKKLTEWPRRHTGTHELARTHSDLISTIFKTFELVKFHNSNLLNKSFRKNRIPPRIFFQRLKQKVLNPVHSLQSSIGTVHCVISMTIVSKNYFLCVQISKCTAEKRRREIDHN